MVYQGRARLDRRTDMLAGRISENIENMAQAMKTPTGVPYGQERLTRSDALTWWKQNRMTPYGQAVLDRWKQMDPNGYDMRVMDLDTALAGAPTQGGY